MRVFTLVFVASLSASTAAECYYRDGSTATDFVPCPSSSFCCTDVDFCESNGLCRDQNNHANGSLTDYAGGPYNYTGLYSTPACQKTSFDGCDLECTGSDWDKVEYVWACGDSLESYCCHDDSNSLGQFDCCQNATRFSLPSPVALVGGSDPTSSSLSSSSTALATTSTSSSIPTTTSTAPSSSSSASTQTQPSSRTSPAFKIGVGVGVPVFVILVAALGFMFWRTHRLHGRLAKQQQSMSTGVNGASGADSAGFLGTGHYKAELDDTHPNELDGTHTTRALELDGMRSPVEAPDNQRPKEERPLIELG